jgi:adhesin/invasin
MKKGKILIKHGGVPLLGIILVTVIILTIWYGCDREGTLNPTDPSVTEYVLLDTLYASRSYAAPTQNVTITAVVRTAEGGPGIGYDVQFITNLGTFSNNNEQIIQPSNSSGLSEVVLSTTVNDTGTADVTGQLLVSQETQTVNIAIGDTSQLIPGEGQLYMWSTYDTIYADNGLSSTPIFARLRDQQNHPLGGQEVVFTTTLGTITSPGITNDSTGVATVMLFSSVDPGTAKIIARYGLVADSILVVFRQLSDAHSIILSSEPHVLEANGTDTTLIRALVRDEVGNPISDGTVVLFSTTSGVLRYSQRTTSGGTATTVLIAPTTSGTATVRADVGNGVFSTLDIPINAGAPTLITVTPYNDTLTADGMSGTEINITVTDAYQNPVPAGQTISLTASIGTIPASVATNTSGQATVTYISGMSPGTASIGATCGNATGYGTIVLVRTTAASVDLSVNPAMLTANGSSTATLTAVILDEQNRSISNGTPVTFYTVYGTLSGGSPPLSAPHRGSIHQNPSANSRRNISLQHSGWVLPRPMGLESTFTTTTQGGMATATLTSPTIIAVDTVRVVVDNIWDSQTVQYIPGSPSIVTVTPLNNTLPADGHSTTSVNILVSDAFLNHVNAGQPINLSAVLGTIFPTSGVTNNQGRMTATFTSGTQTGNASVTATCLSASGSESIQLIAVPLDTIWITITPPTVLADGLSGAAIRAVVYDENGYPVPGTTVHFELDRILGYLSTSYAITDSTGAANISYLGIASTQDEDLHLHTWTTGATPNAEGWQNLTLLGITVSGSANPNTIIADGVSTSQITVHVFETTSFIALSNQTVTFGSSLGSIPYQGTTNNSGLVTVTLTSSNTPGVAHVAARFGNTLTDTVLVTMIESSPTYLSLTANPTIILADNSNTSTLTAVVTDQSNNPVPNGTRVHFEVPPNSGSLESSRPTVNGVATNTLTSSSTPDTVLILAWAEDNTSVRDSATVIYIVGPPQIVLLSAQYDTLLANGIATDTISATVTDAVGHALSNVEVHFTTNRGNITNSQRTNSMGVARVPFSSSTTGIATITATAGNAQGQITIFLVPGNPNSILLSYDPNSVGVRGSGRNETLVITADVRDASNNPVVDGTFVTFSIYASPGGGDFLSSYNPIPTINGHASVSYNSGTISGSVRIRAVCQGIQAISTELQIYSGPPYIENINNGCTSSHLALGASPINFYGWYTVNYSTTLTAVVGDRYNNPVPAGTAVYFTTSGGVINTATGFTDSLGVASVTMLSGAPYPTILRWLTTLRDPNTNAMISCNPTPSNDGVAMVLASSEGVDSSGNSAIAWGICSVIFSGPIDSMYIVSTTVGGNPNLRELYIGESAVITFRLFDDNRHPVVPGSVINCSANAGMVYPGAITTNDPGQIQYVVSFFNNLTAQNDPVSTPVLISVNCQNGSAYVFTDTFMLYNTQHP